MLGFLTLLKGILHSFFFHMKQCYSLYSFGLSQVSAVVEEVLNLST